MALNKYQQAELMRQNRRALERRPIEAELVDEAANAGATLGLREGVRKAGSNKYAQRLGNFVSRHPGRLVGAGTALSLLAGLAELADGDDPLSKNIAEAVGITGGGIMSAAAGTALGAAMGGPLAPITALAGGLLAGSVGSGAGKGLMGGLYDLVSGESDEDRALRNRLKAGRLETQLQVEAAKAMTPVVADQMRIKLADDVQRMERDLAIRNDYNFANTLNTSLLNAQANNAAQQALLTQAMLG